MGLQHYGFMNYTKTQNEIYIKKKKKVKGITTSLTSELFVAVMPVEISL